MEIPLTQNKVAVIDPEDYPLVSGYSWYAVLCNKKWYAQANFIGRSWGRNAANRSIIETATA